MLDFVKISVPLPWELNVYSFKEGLFVGFHLLGFTLSLHTKSETGSNRGSFAWFEFRSRYCCSMLPSFQNKC